MGTADGAAVGAADEQHFAGAGVVDETNAHYSPSSWRDEDESEKKITQWLTWWLFSMAFIIFYLFFCLVFPDEDGLIVRDTQIAGMWPPPRLHQTNDTLPFGGWEREKERGRERQFQCKEQQQSGKDAHWGAYFWNWRRAVRPAALLLLLLLCFAAVILRRWITRK
jgi:hypothetical protein